MDIIDLFFKWFREEELHDEWSDDEIIWGVVKDDVIKFFKELNKPIKEKPTQEQLVLLMYFG